MQRSPTELQEMSMVERWCWSAETNQAHEINRVKPGSRGVGSINESSASFVAVLL